MTDFGASIVPINIAGLIFASVTAVFFVFPPEIPVASGASMNWVIVVVFIALALAGINWLVDGRKRYQSPLNLDELMEKAQAAATLASKAS